MHHLCNGVYVAVVCRHRQAGDSKYTAKLSLEELQAFSEQVNELPCKIKEAALVEVSSAGHQHSYLDNQNMDLSLKIF